MRGKRNYNRFRPRKPEHRINDFITTPKVRVVGDGMEPQVLPIEKAIALAQDKGLDLVEIAPKADPPVCKVVDYKKFLYEKKKKEKEIKSKAHKTVVKEIRFTPNTDDHDFEFKLKHAIKFLEEGAKVKAYVQFRGRHIMFKERGELMLLKLAEKIKDLDIGTLEQLPKLEGRRMIMFMAPKTTGKIKK